MKNRNTKKLKNNKQLINIISSQSIQIVDESLKNRNVQFSGNNAYQFFILNCGYMD